MVALSVASGILRSYYSGRTPAWLGVEPQANDP